MGGTVGGGGSLFIGAPTPAGPQVQVWLVTFNNPGWPGIVLLEPQPFNTDAFLGYEPQGPVNLNPDGTYTFQVTITNNGPNDTFYSLQFSTS